MKEQLIKLKKQRKMVSVYATPSDPGAFIVGTIQAADDDFVFMHLADRNGIDDGYTLCKIENITRIQHDDTYTLGVEKLYGYNSDRQDILFDLADEGNLLDNVITNVCEKKIFVSLYLDEELDVGVTGFITDREDKILFVRHIDSEGYDDGMAILKLDAVYRMVCMGEDNKSIYLLWKDRQKSN